MQSRSKSTFCSEFFAAILRGIIPQEASDVFGYPVLLTATSLGKSIMVAQKRQSQESWVMFMPPDWAGILKHPLAML